MTRIGLGAAAILTLAALVVGCSAAPKRRAPRVPILVARAEQRSIPYEIEATGTVEPMQSAEVTPQVGGPVTKIAFHEGDEVRAGQVLIQIDPRPFLAAAERAAGALARDRAMEQAARNDFERSQELAKQSVISESELDTKRSAWLSSAASARSDSAALASARLDLANATLRAPISGKTGALSIHIGDLARANDANGAAVTINQIRPIRVRFTVPQSDLPELRRQRGRALPVEVVTGESDTTWIPGKLAFVDNQVDAASGTVLLKAEFPNLHSELWPGEFVRVRLRMFDQAGAVVVPSAAVTSSQSGPYLYVVKADTTVETRKVVVSRTWRDLTVIADGVEPGETVVTDGQLRLSPGAKAAIRSPQGQGSEKRASDERPNREGGGVNRAGGNAGGTAAGERAASDGAGGTR
jgi:membrane fusion protein, multidrug efflux system